MEWGFSTVIALLATFVLIVGLLGLVADQSRRDRYGLTPRFRYGSSSGGWAALSATLAGIAAVVTLSGVLFSDPLKSTRDLNKLKFDGSELAAVQSAIQELKQRNFGIEEGLKTIRAGGQGTSGIDLESWSTLQSDVVGLKNAVARFEGLLLSDAEKLLTLPLVKRDMDVFRSEISGMRSQMELQTRVLQEAQTQGRWIIGTLALGMLALVVTAFTALRSGKNSTQEGMKASE